MREKLTSEYHIMYRIVQAPACYDSVLLCSVVLLFISPARALSATILSPGAISASTFLSHSYQETAAGHLWQAVQSEGGVQLAPL